jgi:hypothetical protein
MASLEFLQEQGTVGKIDRAYEEARKSRGYLGLSQAGHECKRHLWYEHNGYEGEPIEGRVLRLFQLGNLVEEQVVADLAMAGCLVYHQQREVVFTQGDVKLVGHIDGIVIGLQESPNTPHLFECKSASKKKYDELLKAGSYEAWNTTYFWQIQFYLLGLGLKRAAVFVYCKDDSRLYMERIKLRRQETIDLLALVFESVTSPIEPDRLCPRADNYKAKWCKYKAHCFGTKTVEKKDGVMW